MPRLIFIPLLALAACTQPAPLLMTTPDVRSTPQGAYIYPVMETGQLVYARTPKP